MKQKSTILIITIILLGLFIIKIDEYKKDKQIKKEDNLNTTIVSKTTTTTKKITTTKKKTSQVKKSTTTKKKTSQVKKSTTTLSTTTTTKSTTIKNTTTKNKIKIEFINYNSSRIKGDLPEDILVNKGEKIILPENKATRKKEIKGIVFLYYGYTRVSTDTTWRPDTYKNSYYIYESNGWSLEKNSTNCDYKNNEVIEVSENMVLYPCYERKDEGAKFPDLIREGYVLDGWYSYQGCSGRKYQYNEFNGMNEISLYACWKKE